MLSTIDFDALVRHQRIDVFRDASSIILYRIPSISLQRSSKRATEILETSLITVYTLTRYSI